MRINREVYVIKSRLLAKMAEALPCFTLFQLGTTWMHKVTTTTREQDSPSAGEVSALKDSGERAQGVYIRVNCTLRIRVTVPT